MHQMPSQSSPTAVPASTAPPSTSGPPQSTSIASASALLSTASPDAHMSSWNADTGASAHMTFNCYWIYYMTVHCIPIHLADGSVVYSEGIGTVQFAPVVNGQEMAPLEFTNVLYVPSLSSSLFSVLYLTMHCSFTIFIFFFCKSSNLIL